MKRVLAFILALAMTFALAACSNDGSQSSTADNSTSQADDSSSGGATGEKIKIGFSFPTKNNEFWNNALTFMQQAAEQLNIDLQEVSCDNKQAQQVEDVNNLLASGIQGLVLCPQDASICAGIANSCKEKNIPLVICDRWPGDDLVPGEDYVAFVGPNDEQMGEGVAEALIAAGAKKMVAIGGYDGTSVAEGRKTGLEKAIANHDGEVELLQYQAAGENYEDGDEAIRSLYQAHSDLDSVWCYNDSLSLAVVNFAKEKGIKILTGGVDLQEQAVEEIEAGNMTYSIGGHYLQCSFGLIMVYDKINGHDPSETNVKLDCIGVDSSNYQQYKDKYLSGDSSIDFKNMSKVYNPDAEGYYEITL